MNWTVSEGVNYECACEAINHVIAFYSAAIDDEEHKPSPNLQAIEAMRSERQRLATERRALSVTDQDELKRVTELYSKFVRQIRHG